MIPGSIKHEERLTAIRKSRKIIVILSNSYVTSSECQGEANMAGKTFLSAIAPVTFYKGENTSVVFPEQYPAMITPFSKCMGHIRHTYT
mgnify:CR=1 FL=1